MINPIELNASADTLQRTVHLLDQLDNRFELRTMPKSFAPTTIGAEEDTFDSSDSALVLYLCVGQHKGGWCGLIGISVESGY